MIKTLLRSIALAGSVLLMASSASAFCIDTAIFGGNEVALTGCAGINAATAVCDMNGVQDRWATHGVFAISNGEWILSWTRNTPDDTQEWVCRMNPATFLGIGAVHTFSGIAGVGKSHTTFDCVLNAVCQD